MGNAQPPYSESQRIDDRPLQSLGQPGQPLGNYHHVIDKNAAEALKQQQAPQLMQTVLPSRQPASLAGPLAPPSYVSVPQHHLQASNASGAPVPALAAPHAVAATGAGPLPMPPAAASALQESGQPYMYYASASAPSAFRGPVAGAPQRQQPLAPAQPLQAPAYQSFLPAPPPPVPAATTPFAVGTPRHEPPFSLPDLACSLVTAVEVERQWCGPGSRTVGLNELFDLQAIAGEAGIHWATASGPNAMVAERLSVIFSKVKRQLMEAQAPLTIWFAQRMLQVIEWRWASAVGRAPPQWDDGPNLFTQGQKVHYFSQTHSAWVEGIVYGAHPGGGAYDLTCKAAAVVERIRRDPPLVPVSKRDSCTASNREDGTPQQQVLVPGHPVGGTGILDFSALPAGAHRVASSSRSTSLAPSRAPTTPAPLVVGAGSVSVSAMRAQHPPQVTPAGCSVSPQRAQSWREPSRASASPLRSSQSRIIAAPPPPAGWGFEAPAKPVERQRSELLPATVIDVQDLAAASVAYAADMQATVEIISPPRSRSPSKQRGYAADMLSLSPSKQQGYNSGFLCELATSAILATVENMSPTRSQSPSKQRGYAADMQPTVEIISPPRSYSPSKQRGSPSRGRSRSNSPRKSYKTQVQPLRSPLQELEKGSVAYNGIARTPSQGQAEQVQVMSRKLRETISNSPERRRREELRAHPRGSLTARDSTGSAACEEAAVAARRLRERCESFLREMKADSARPLLDSTSEMVPTTQFLPGG